MYKVLKTKIFCDTIEVWKIGYIIPCEKARFDTHNPPVIASTNYKQWITRLDPKVCLECMDMHGKIFRNNEPLDIEPPLHPMCRCSILPMGAVVAGTATKDGKQGADWYLKYTGQLPSYYISEEELRKLGWRKGDKPAKFASGKMLGGEIYRNEDGKLPEKAGRIWYEADINYYSGVRNQHRIFWSNDGLIFVTYNHGLDFYEVV